MIQVKKVLCPIDIFPCESQALDRGIHLAAEYGAELHMLHAVVLNENSVQYPIAPVNDYEDIHQYLEDHARMEMKIAIASRDNVPSHIVMVGRRGVAAADVILEYAGEKDIDLIVMGTHGRHGFGRLLLGSVAEEVVRKAECPVLTLREEKQSPAVTAIERILVPVDYSEHSKVALRHARELAVSQKAKLQLLHVIDEPVYPAFYGPGEDYENTPRSYIRNRAAREMERLCKEVSGPEVETQIQILSGHVALEINKFAADKQSDLIVIASHGLTGIKRLLLGSVAEKVVRMAPCPVVTIKAFGKSLITAPYESHACEAAVSAQALTVGVE